MLPFVARYREFAPCPALRNHVRRLFTFTAPAAERDDPGPALLSETRFGPEQPYSSPLFADGHASIVFAFGSGYCIDGLWAPARGSRGEVGHLIGPMTAARATSLGARIVQVGAYFHAAGLRAITGVPAAECTDRVIALGDLWGASAATIELRLAESRTDGERVAALEEALLARCRGAVATPFDVRGVADWIVRARGALKIEEMAQETGLSRQHFTRLFRESVGVPPKLYARLARFRGALSQAKAREQDWAGIAAELGYADQSHLISEIRQFAGLTPRVLRSERSFHPFVGSDTV